MKTVVFTHPAAKQHDALPGDVRETIDDALAIYAVSGVGDVKRLQGRNEYRLRVGRYRVIFDEDAVSILAVQIGKRDSKTYR